MKNFIKINKNLIILLIITIFLSIIVNLFCTDFINKIDSLIIINQNDKITNVLRVLTYLGSACFYIPILILFIIIKKTRKETIYISIGLYLTHLINFLMKHIIRKDRPLNNLAEVIGYSFPSGHSMSGVFFYGMLIYLINKKIRNKVLRIILSILSLLILTIIIISRLYLSVHFITDIMIGSILGFIILLMFINYDRKENII